MSDSDNLEAAIDRFEHSTDRAFHIRLARNCLATVSDDYADDQLDDIGRRARHWMAKAIREAVVEMGDWHPMSGKYAAASSPPDEAFR